MSQKGIVEDFIRAKGAVTFEEFMELSLYHPRGGYYTGEGQKIGMGGDFYTSPEVSPLFGHCLARQLEEMWELLGRPSPWQVVEYGAGSGKMARDILQYLKDTGGEFYQVLTYYIVEISPYFKKVQQNCLEASNAAEKVLWVSEEELALKVGPSAGYETSVTGCFISNEFVDAMPVHRLKIEDQKLLEAWVTIKDGALVQFWQPNDNVELEKYFSWLGVYPFGNHEVEVNLRAESWIKQVAQILKRGFIITIDYGSKTRDLYTESRPCGTLRCYKGHRLLENPLEHPGQSDITASVDFSALTKWGEEAGLATEGYTSQTCFLLNMGIFDMVTSKRTYSFDFNSLKETMAVKKLVLPEGMGNTFKFLCQSKGFMEPMVLKGFKRLSQK